jgi:Tfp pilus assembly protein PilO
MTEKKTKLAITLSTILLFVALVVLILYLIPRVSQLKLLSHQVESKRVEYESGKLKIQNAEALQSMLGQYKKEAELLGIALPGKSKAEDALVELSEAAKGSGLEIVSADVSDEKGSLLVDLSTKGTYENQVGFLDKLKNNLRPIKVVEIEMTKIDDKIVTNLKLNFPYFSSLAESNSQTNQSAK